MKTGLSQLCRDSHQLDSLPASELFRARFQSSLRRCLRRRFSVAECFGVIWLETLEEIPIEEPDQGRLYEELIGWAKNQLFIELARDARPPA